MPQRTALVTGSSRGIGRAIALRLGPWQRRRLLVTYLLIQLASFALSTVSPIAEAMQSQGLRRIGDFLLALCPMAYALATVPGAMTLTGRPSTAANVAFAVVSALVLGTAAFNTARAWRRIFELGREPTG